MTNELKAVVENIDLELKNYLKKEESIKFIFKKEEKIYLREGFDDNLLDIKIIYDFIEKNKVIKLESFIKQIQKKYQESIICSSLLEETNYNLLNDKDRIIFNLTIHDINYLNNSLEEYKIFFGKNILETNLKINYTLNELEKHFSYFYNFINIVSTKKYNNYIFDINENTYKIKEKSLKEEELFQLAFYTFYKFINYFINYCNYNKYDIPKDKMCLLIYLLGKSNINNNNLFLLHGLFTKSITILKAMFENPIDEVIKLFNLLEIKVNEIDNIFKKEETKTKKLIKN